MRTYALYATIIVLGLVQPMLGALSAAGLPHRTSYALSTLAAWYSFAMLIAGINLWTSFGRAWTWKLVGRSMEHYRGVSGVPFVGTIAAGVACVATAGDLVSGLLVVALAVADTGGLTWFALQACRSRLFR